VAIGTHPAAESGVHACRLVGYDSVAADDGDIAPASGSVVVRVASTAVAHLGIVPASVAFVAVGDLFVEFAVGRRHDQTLHDLHGQEVVGVVAAAVAAASLVADVVGCEIDFLTFPGHGHPFREAPPSGSVRN